MLRNECKIAALNETQRVPQESEPRYDIAMLYLDRDVRLAPNVAPACLPQPQYLNLPPGALGTVVG